MKPEPQTAPLTIFYGGQVIVFNDFSAEKAKEVMNLASKGTANTFTGFTSSLNNNIAPTPNQVPHLMKTASQDPKQTSSAAMACGNLSHPLFDFHLLLATFFFVVIQLLTENCSFLYYRTSYCEKSFTSSVLSQEKG